MKGRSIEGAESGRLRWRKRVRQRRRRTGHRACAFCKVGRPFVCIERLVGGDGRHRAVQRIAVSSRPRRGSGAPERGEDA